MQSLAREQPKFAWINDEITAFLIDKKTLQAWSPFSTATRVDMLRSLFGLSMTRNTLRLFYQHHNIRYKGTRTCYDAALRKR